MESIYAQYLTTTLFVFIMFLILEWISRSKVHYGEAAIFSVVIGFATLLSLVKQWSMFSWQCIVLLAVAIFIVRKLKKIMYGLPRRK